MQLLDIASAEKMLPRLAVEKDWWISVVLKAMTMTQYAGLYSFKGGTSLSRDGDLLNALVKMWTFPSKERTVLQLREPPTRN